MSPEQRDNSVVARVFVYGTLLSGEANFHVLQDQKLVGKAETRGRIFDYGFAPGAVPSSEISDILHGEIYDVDARTLARLDGLEGVDHRNPHRGNYRREVIEATLEGGEVLHPQIYWHNWSPSGKARRLVHGDWKRRRE